MSNNIIMNYMKETASSIDSVLVDILKNEPEYVSHLPLIRVSKPKILPALARAVYQADGREWNSIKPFLASLELGTCAQYVLDDLLDDQNVREGKPSTSSLFGKDSATYAYNRLMELSADIFMQIDNENFIHAYSEWIDTMDNLEHYQRDESKKRTFDIVSSLKNFNIPEYLGRCAAIAGTPASTICNISSELSSGVNFSDFGLYFGIACQLRNDAMDFIPKDILKMSKALSKDPYEDLRQGMATMPLYICYMYDRRETVELLQNHDYLGLTILMANNGTIKDVNSMTQNFLSLAKIESVTKNIEIFQGLLGLFGNTEKYFANYCRTNVGIEI